MLENKISEMPSYQYYLKYRFIKIQQSLFQRKSTQCRILRCTTLKTCSFYNQNIFLRKVESIKLIECLINKTTKKNTYSSKQEQIPEPFLWYLNSIFVFTKRFERKSNNAKVSKNGGKEFTFRKQFKSKIQ